jgi:hypothetical protein
MFSTRIIAALALCALAGAQTTITNTLPAVLGYLDLMTNGGTTVVPPPSLGSEHNIVTTVGNFLFPPGDVRIANDGVAIAGTTAGDVSSTNVAIPAAGFPAGLPVGAAAILPWWDGLCPTGIPGSIWWKQAAGVLYIEWIGESRFVFCDINVIKFEIQVFESPGPGAPLIQILYPDTEFFTGILPPPFPQSDPCNNGACATIGYVGLFGSNVQWSHNTSSVPSGSVLSILGFPMGLTASSPLGPGSLKLDLTFGPPSGAYFLAVTLAPGAYPDGWLFGLDISYADLAFQLSAGFPFSGPLGVSGAFSLGPMPGVPPLTLFAVAFGFPPGSPVPSTHTSPISYAIP